MMKYVLIPLALIYLSASAGTASAADCNAVAQAAAQKQNAQIISAKLVDQNGNAACEVVMLQSSSDGPRKRVTVILPAS